MGTLISDKGTFIENIRIKQNEKNKYKRNIFVTNFFCDISTSFGTNQAQFYNEASVKVKANVSPSA